MLAAATSDDQCREKSADRCAQTTTERIIDQREPLQEEGCDEDATTTYNGSNYRFGQHATTALGGLRRADRPRRSRCDSPT